MDVIFLESVQHGLLLMSRKLFSGSGYDTSSNANSIYIGCFTGRTFFFNKIRPRKKKFWQIQVAVQVAVLVLTTWMIFFCSGLQHGRTFYTTTTTTGRLN